MKCKEFQCPLLIMNSEKTLKFRSSLHGLNFLKLEKCSVHQLYDKSSLAQAEKPGSLKLQYNSNIFDT